MLNIYVEDFENERFAEFHDYKNILIKIIYDYQSINNLRVLKYVDPYDDTTFNRLMINDCILDIYEINETISNDNNEHKKLLIEVKKLCEIALNNSHSYLKFYGD